MSETKKTIEKVEEVKENPVVAKLKEYGITAEIIKNIEEKLGVETLEDLYVLEVEDLTGVGLKLAKARRLVSDLKKEQKATVMSEATTKAAAIPPALEMLLPSVPTDESWLTALKTGGILKVDDSSYIAAIRAALADRAGLYNVPEALAKAMEKYADETEEQVDPTFYALRKSLTRRAYGDIFAAIDGLDGSFITEGRRNEFLGRIRTTLWPAIAESYQALDAWYETRRSNLLDPSMLSASIVGALNGSSAVGMLPPPDTSLLHDAADTLVNSINRVFRGTGVQIVAAMAYEANNIRNTLEDPRLPSMVGVKNRELMLKKIGASVSSNYVRLEQNLVKYVLGFVKHDTITSDAEVDYFVALWQLGSQINWSELGVAKPERGGVKGLTGKNIL
ncbi:hypothetical protein IJI89_03065 [Candidatus Saccharibacteria bacterium]|nr:hypothetical protein [Candidatus Saccharibacteria bacterium]